VAYPVKGRSDASTEDLVVDVADRRASDGRPGQCLIS